MKPRRRRPAAAGRQASGPRADRKTLQLCGQVARTLDQVLAEQERALLRDLHVESVVPTAEGGHLIVSVRSLDAKADPMAILSGLAEASADLRLEVAGAITRRRVPSLAFRVVPTDSSPTGPA